jgi:dTDP-4-dehydrorhamnose 3,5-epimerase-like enzyme
LGIDWPVHSPILSDKDSKAPRLADIAPPFPKGSW